MAYNHPAGSSSSFQQEQVAYPYFLDSPFDIAHSASSFSTASSSSAYPGSSFSSSSSFSITSAPSSSSRPGSTRHPYPSSYGRSVDSRPSSQPFVDAQFDIFEWHVQYQSCVRYFLDHAQYSGPVQAVAAFVNIQLPFQRPVHPILSSAPGNIPVAGPSSRSAAATAAQPNAFVTLVPYIRRLIATAFDFPAVLHGFFGDDWMTGIGPIHETERRNYLFAAKSDNWLKVKTDYDIGDDQTVPFLRPLQNVSEKEIINAETTWSEWLAMQDWMLGPRAPGGVGSASGSHGRVSIKREED